MPFDRAMVKLDFKNAFNCIRRDCMLEAISIHIPNLLHFVQSAYTESFFLSFGNFKTLSQESVQQGDPMGPLLFTLTLADVLNRCLSEFTVGYLDDIILGDSVSKLVDQVKKTLKRNRQRLDSC